MQRFPAVFPAARSGHAMSYDSARGRVVLFGGTNWQIGAAYTDTWEWDGVTWTQRFPLTSPTYSYGSIKMAFDSARNVSVLVTAGGETWEWDGYNWAFRAQGVPYSPGARAMAFDSNRGRTVLLVAGANTFVGAPAVTMEWDGSSWQTIITPTGPHDHAVVDSMTFDPVRGKCQVYMSEMGYGSPSGSGYQMWEWDGLSWSSTYSGGATYLHGYRIAYHEGLGKTILFGGSQRSGTFYSGQYTYQWTPLGWTGGPTRNAPNARYEPGMVYDSARNRLVLFGGYEVGAVVGPMLSDTWETPSVPVTAEAVTYGLGCGTPSLALVPQVANRPLLGGTHVSSISNETLGLTAFAWGFSNQRFSFMLDLPLQLDVWGIDGCDLWTSAEATLGWPCIVVGGSTELHFAIPNDALLTGVQVYLQAWTLRDGANPFGVVFSNGVALTIGDV